MSGKQFGKAYLRGCGLQLAIAVIGGVMGLALVGLALFLVQDARPEDELRIMLIVGFAQLLMMGAIALVAVWVVRRRSRRLDRGFANAPGSNVSPNLRNWKGEVRGRPFNAWVARGPRLELYLECTVGTRAAIRRVGPAIQAFGRLLDSKTLPMESPAALADCEVLSRDAEWMRRFLRRPGVARIAAELMAPSARVLPGIRLSPDSIGYLRQFIKLSEVNEARINGWLEQLSTLADAVDAIGPSTSDPEPSRLETWARTSRRLPVHPIFIGVGCGLFAVGVISVVVFAIVAFLEMR